jgi:hypothetical protein
MAELIHIALDKVAEYVHYRVMATITKRLDKRYAVEGDELAKEAADAIRELREALIAMVTDPVNGLRQARTALAKHR